MTLTITYGGSQAILDAYSYGVRADGTNQATNMQTFLDACRDAGPGAHGIMPPGTILTSGTLLFDSYVNLSGAGQSVTILKQAPSSNLGAVLQSRDYASLIGAGTSLQGQRGFTLHDFSIDGNKQNNTSVQTDGLRVYGYRYDVQRIAILNCKGMGAQAHWGGSPYTPTDPEPGNISGSPMESFWSEIRVYNNDRTGLYHNGPNDSVLDKIFAADNAFAPQANGPSPPVDPSIWIGAKSLACIISNSHSWNGGTYGYQFDGAANAINCHAEGAWYACVLIDYDGVRWIGGRVFGSTGMIYSNNVGFKISANSAMIVDVSMDELIGGAFDFTTHGGGSFVIGAMMYTSSASYPLYTGSPSNLGTWDLRGSMGGDNPANKLPATARKVMQSDSRTDFAAVGEDEDFLNASGTSGQIGRLGWTEFLSGTGAVAPTASVSNHPGIQRLTTGATSASLAALALAADGTSGSFVSQQEHDHVFIFKAGQADANTLMRIGLQTNPASNPDTDGIYMEKLAADTNWFYVCRGAGVQTRVDSGIAAGTAWRRLRIRWYFTAALRFVFSLDGGTTTEITTNLPGLSVPLAPVIQIVNSAAAAKTLDVDYYGMRLIALNR